MQPDKIIINLQEETSKDPEVKHSAKENVFKINCYPNPFVSNFTIESLDNKTDRIMVEVTDIKGRRVFHQYDLPGNQTVKISANHFAKGMYLVRAVAEEHVAIFKIIKK